MRHGSSIETHQVCQYLLTASSLKLFSQLCKYEIDTLKLVNICKITRSAWMVGENTVLRLVFWTESHWPWGHKHPGLSGVANVLLQLSRNYLCLKTVRDYRPCYTISYNVEAYNSITRWVVFVCNAPWNRWCYIVVKEVPNMSLFVLRVWVHSWSVALSDLLTFALMRSSNFFIDTDLWGLLYEMLFEAHVKSFRCLIGRMPKKGVA